MPRPSLVTRLEPTLITNRDVPAGSDLVTTRRCPRCGGASVLRARATRRPAPHPLPAQRIDELAYPLVARIARHEVELVQHEPSRLRCELRIVFFELLRDRTCIGDRIGRWIRWNDVDEMEQQARSL